MEVLDIYTVAKSYDPTQTTALRNAFARDMNKRFLEITSAIREGVDKRDCFGLKKDVLTLQVIPPEFRQFAFLRDPEKVEAFMAWLQQQVDRGLLKVGVFQQVGTAIEAAWTNMYVFDSYKRGVIRARYELQKAGMTIPPIDDINLFMNTPFHMDRCFINGNVKIFTSKGWKKIKDVIVGDLVLTHNMRFRKVTSLIRTPKQIPDVVNIGLKYQGNSKYEKEKLSIIATNGHPFLTNKGWVNIDKIQIGDKVKYLASYCKTCEEEIPYWRTYCSTKCNGKDSAKTSGWGKNDAKRKEVNKLISEGRKQAFKNGSLNCFEVTKSANKRTVELAKEGKLWLQNLSKQQMEEMQTLAYNGKKEDIEQGLFGFQNEDIRTKAIDKGSLVVRERIKNGDWTLQRPVVREKAIENAKVSVSKLVKEGNWGTQREWHQEKVIEGIAKYRRNLHKKFIRKGAGQTKIELKLANLLDNIGIKYTSEYNIGKYIVDFALPELYIAIEADGDYWHKTRQEQDAFRQKKIEDKGWTVLRFSESEINNKIELVEDELRRVICNHTGQYNTMELEVCSIKKYKVKSPRMLYNLSVEDDESYIVNGFVVHNCGLLFTRVYTELKNITSAMDLQISKVLSQGLIDGDGPRLLARKLISTINGTGMGDLGLTDTLGRFIPAQRRAEMLARTEIIRAHHQATIQEYRNWGIEGITVLGEWMTAGDERVCFRCSSLQGKIFTLDEIEPMIPLHPMCRCIALPWIKELQKYY